MTQVTRGAGRIGVAVMCAAAAGGSLGWAAAGAASPAARGMAASPESQAPENAATPQGQRRPTVARHTHPGRDVGAAGVSASALFLDAVDDTVLAPDLQSMLAFTEDEGRFTVSIRLGTNALVDGDYIHTFVNTDGNAHTGDAAFGGADVAVSIVGATGTDAVAVARWDGGGFQRSYVPSLVSFPAGVTDEVWSVAAADIGIASGTPTTLMFATSYEGVYDDYYDFAPEPGLPPFAFTAGPLSPPPPAPVTPPPPAAPAPAPAPTPAAGVANIDPAPSPPPPLTLRTLGLQRTGAGVRLRIAWAGGSGRVIWRATLRGRVAGRSVTRTVRGFGAPGARTITRSVALAPAWRSAAVTTRLEVEDDYRTINRTRTLPAVGRPG